MLRKSLALAALLAGSPLAAAPTTSLAQDAKIFGKRESAWSVEFSPSGSKVVMLIGGPAGSTVVKVFDLATGGSKAILGSRNSKESLDWCDWANEQKLICRYSGIMRAPDDGVLIPFSRHMLVSADGSGMKPLGQKASDKDKGLRQFDGRIVDWMPMDGTAVLMARQYLAEEGTTGTNVARTTSGLAIDRIELDTMDFRTLEQPRDEISDYMSDGQGNVRIAIVDSAFAGELTGKTRYKYRKPGSRDWEPLGEYNSMNGEGIYPLAIEAQSNSAFVLRKTSGRDALYRMNLDGTGTTSLVASNPKVDISGVVRVGRGRKVIGYTYSDEFNHVVYFEPEYEKLASALGKALPKTPLIDFDGSSNDEQRLLIFAGADTHPGTYMYLDRPTKKLSTLADVRPELDGRALATVKATSYAAADGTRIPAYLTVPAGSTGKNMPAVVLPHGGPSSRDQWGFDWLPQFLAARGYVVIQPQYRGSAGYGDEFLNGNALKNWKAAISDISDSARYLAKEGIADPNRIAIVGWSYGGYAALQSAASQPGLYKAAVAIAPVTDLAQLKKDAENYTNAKLVAAQVGSGPHIKEGSPLQNVDRIQVPVLLFHGDLDLNVDVGHSERMNSALKRAGKAVQYSRYKDLDHALDDSDARADMLAKIGTALEAAIGN
jgi:dipeptidyl aminopeptidase/acylaminoacyl peptidase